MIYSQTVRFDGGINWDNATSKYLNILSSSNEKLQVKSTLRLAKLSKIAPIEVLSTVIPILLNLLADSSPNLKAASAFSLSYIINQENTDELSTIIENSGTIRLIVRLLPDSEGLLHRCLLNFLSSVVSNHCPSRITLARTGGLGVIMDLIRTNPINSKVYLLEILSALALDREVRREIVVVHNPDGISYLIEAILFGKTVSKTRAAQAVGLLAISNKVRDLLVNRGAILALVGLLRDGDVPAKIVASNALGIISSGPEYLTQVGYSGAIPLYVNLLKASDNTLKEIAEDVLCILAVKAENSVLILEQLLGIIQGGGNSYSKGAAIDILWSLAGYNHIIPCFLNSGIIPALFDLIQNGTDAEIKEKALAVFSQLSYEEEYRNVMAGIGVIPVLIGIVRGDCEELREFAGEALVNFVDDSAYRDRVSDVVHVPSYMAIRDRLVRIREMVV